MSEDNTAPVAEGEATTGTEEGADLSWPSVDVPAEETETPEAE